MHFGIQNESKMHLKIDSKIKDFFNDFWKRWWKDFRRQMPSIFEAYGLHFQLIFRSGVFVKIRTALERERQNQGSGGSTVVPKSIQKRFKKTIKNPCFFY